MKSNLALISHPVRLGDFFFVFDQPFKPTKGQKWIRYNDELYYIQRYYTSLLYFLTKMKLVHEPLVVPTGYKLILTKKRKSFYENLI